VISRARGIFLRKSLSKVVEVLTACHFVSRDEIKGASALDPNTHPIAKIPREKFRTKINTTRARETVRQLAIQKQNHHIVKTKPDKIY
jgi:hypothetical protein